MAKSGRNMTFHAVLIVILHFTGFCSGMALPNPTAEDLDDTVPLLARSLEGNHRLIMSHSTTTYSYSAKTTSGGSSFDRFGTAEKDVNSSVGKITVKNSDMEGEMKQDAIDLTEDAFKQFTVEKDIAAHIKKEFDRKHGNSWHCIVGRNYGSYVMRHFLDYRVGKDGGNSSVGGITVEHTDMENEMKQEAIAVTEDAFEQFTVEEEIENFIKNEFEEKYGNTWTCIVGRKKGSYVTHETNEFIFMRAGQVDVLLYRSG